MTDLLAWEPRTIEVGQQVGSTALNILVFVLFIGVTMGLVIKASRTTKKATDFYTGGATFTGPQNGFAIAGDYLSAASMSLIHI